jgi:hypothetical protein
MRGYKLNLNREEKGLIIPLFSILVILFVLFLGLLLGGGSLMVNKSRLDKISNFVALAALEGYMRYKPPFGVIETKEQTVSNKISESHKSAKNIILDNKFLLALSDISDLAIYNGSSSEHVSELRYGIWFEQEPIKCPIASGCVCDKVNEKVPRKPCFKSVASSEISSVNIDINATKVIAKTPKNAWFAPFTMLFKKSSLFDTQSFAVAKAQERCTVFAVDISSSSFADSHNFVGDSLSATNDLSRKFLHIDNPFGVDMLGNYAIGLPNDSTPAPWRNSAYEYDCNIDVPSPLPLSTNNNISPNLTNYAYYCSFQESRPANCNSGAITSSCNKHYRSDFEKILTLDGEYFIDKFRAPEPLSSIMMSINAGLRSLKSTLSSVDYIALIPFADIEYAPIPSVGLTRDLNFMIDMTDMRRSGKRVLSGGNWITDNEKHPNFIDRNWFPLDDRSVSPAPKSGTNILKILHDSIERLVNQNFCPVSAKKSIILASDGIYTQYYKPIDGKVDWDNPSKLTRGVHLKAADDLLFNNFSLRDNILKRLIENKISLTTILTGNTVEPNFINVRKDGSTDKFLSLVELAANGYRGIPNPLASPPEYAISNISSDLPSYIPPRFLRPGSVCNPLTFNQEECALLNLIWGIPKVKFRRSNGVFAQLSIMSNGLFCPIMEPYRLGKSINSDCYDSSKEWKNGGGCERIDGGFQTISVYGDELGGQAAKCVGTVLGLTPFSIVTNESFPEPQ